MSASYAQMNSTAAAYCDGSFAAPMASFLLIFAGIALAMSVVFFSAAVLAVRLCIVILVSVCVIPLLVLIPGMRQSRER